MMQISKSKPRKKKLKEKQIQAEKMIAEGTERLGVALNSGRLQDALPAQALLESGNKMLSECRHELLLLDKSGAHHPNKVQL